MRVRKMTDAQLDLIKDRDSEYAREINKLIPIAEEYADEFVKLEVYPTEIRTGADGVKYAFDKWSNKFHFWMNYLAAERGLRREAKVGASGNK